MEGTILKQKILSNDAMAIKVYDDFLKGKYGVLDLAESKTLVNNTIKVYNDKIEIADELKNYFTKQFKEALLTDGTLRDSLTLFLLGTELIVDIINRKFYNCINEEGVSVKIKRVIYLSDTIKKEYLEAVRDKRDRNFRINSGLEDIRIEKNDGQQILKFSGYSKKVYDLYSRIAIRNKIWSKYTHQNFGKDVAFLTRENQAVRFAWYINKLRVSEGTMMYFENFLNKNDISFLNSKRYPG